MTIQIDLPKDVEDRLRAEVSAGRHAMIADAVLEKFSRWEDPDLLAIARTSWLRQDLEDGWSNRQRAVDGEAFFARRAERSLENR